MKTNNKPKLIGIAGKAGAGKDTLALYLARRHGMLVTTFAEPLKAAASTLFGMPRDFFIDRDKKDTLFPSWGRSPRQLLVELGDTLKDKFGPNLFAHAWMAYVAPVLDMNNTTVVVSDVRFGAEVEVVRALGGRIIHIVRPGVEPCSAANHASEQFDPQWADFTLVNDGSIKDMQDEIDTYLVSLTLQLARHRKA